jgi:hypothetical protein
MLSEALLIAEDSMVSFRLVDVPWALIRSTS